MHFNFNEVTLPDNMQVILEEQGAWELDRFDPFFMAAELVENEEDQSKPLIFYSFAFEPHRPEFNVLNKKLALLEFDIDGYGWGDFLFSSIAERDEELYQLLDVDCLEGVCCLYIQGEQEFKLMLKLIRKTLEQLKK